MIFFLLLCYLMYAFYKKMQKPQEESKIKNLGKAKVAPEGSCPTPKTFVDYIEGRIEGRQKKQIRNHVDNCQNCMEALRAIFNVHTGEGLKKIKLPE